MGLAFVLIHLIHNSLTECYHTFNHKDHWDLGLFTCYDMLQINTLLISSNGYYPLRLKHTVGILLHTNMLSQFVVKLLYTNMLS